jgi:predicted lipid carrier protein YhbT
MNLTDFRFPSAVTTLGRLIPSPLASLPLMAALELARRREWLVAPEALYGKRFLIHIEDMGLQIRFICDQGRFKPLFDATDAPADVKLSAMAVDFFQMTSGMADADTLFFQRKLKMEGDTELGVAVKYWLDASERPAWLSALADRLA